MNNNTNLGQKVSIYVRIHFNNTVLHPCPSLSFINNQSPEIQLSSLLKFIRAFILKQKLKSFRFLQIYIKTQKGEENIYYLIKTRRKIILKQEDDSFYVDVYLKDVVENHQNLLIQYIEQEQKYKKIMEKLSRVDDIFSRQANTLNDQQKRSIDIAYFFAEPLVIPNNQKSFSSQSNQVSYQKEYDKFIQILKRQTLQNITVDMMVATQLNIRDALEEKCNILHFSCHGQTNGLLIEKQIGIRHLLTSQQFIKLLQGKTKPKLIIFNVCYSARIAEAVHNKYNEIATIGYTEKSNDVYCQLLTERFYDEIFKKNKPFKEVFNIIVNQIKSKKDPKAFEQAQKLKIYIKGDKLLQKSQLSNNQGWSVKWGYLQNLGKQDPLGVKLLLFKFIKQHFIPHEKQFFFFYGPQGRGKSIFIKKAALYSLHRKLFKQKIQIDCKLSQTDIISNVLRFKLKFQNQLFDNLQRYRNRKVVIIIDHCNQIMRSQAVTFLAYVRKLFNKMNMGKIVIITDILPLNLNNIRKYEMPEVDFKSQINKYLLRYNPRIKYNQNYDCYTLIKHIKSSSNNQEFLKQLKQHDQKKKIQSHIDNLEIQNFSQVFKDYEKKIIECRQKLRAHITKGHYIRNQEIFPLVEFISHFPKASLQETNSIGQVYLFQVYETVLKGIIGKLTKFIKQTQISSNEEIQKIHFIIRSILLIPNMCFVAQKYEVMVEQLFKIYTFCVTIIHIKNQLINTQQLLKACQALKLKIFVILYCYYKDSSIKTQQCESFMELQENCWSQKSAQSSQMNKQKQILQTFKILEEQLISQYEQTEVQDLIKLFCELDSFIRKILSNKCYQSIHLPTYRKTVQFYNQQIQKYYKIVAKFFQYKKEEESKFFFSKWELKIVHLIGLKIINSFLTYFQFNYHFEYGSSIIQYFNNYRQIAGQAQKYLKDVSYSKIKGENDHSYISLYRKYMEIYIQTRFKLQKFYSTISGERKSLLIFKTLIKMSIENKISHLKEIQEYVQQTYFNKCTILISQPLGYYKKEEIKYEKQKNKNKKQTKKDIGKKYASNLQTRQFQPLNFVRNSEKLLKLKQDVQKSVQKEIHISIQTLTLQKIKNSNEGQQNLIYMIICDCQQKKHDVIYLQNKYGLSQQIPIKNLSDPNLKLPKASVVIAYGTYIELLRGVYEQYIKKNQLQMAFISLNIPLPSTKKGIFSDLYVIWDEHLAKQVSFTFLMNFYESFCKVYFNKEHNNYSEQIHKSYRFAERQSIIKTKLKYCEGVNNKVIVDYINILVKENLQIYFPFDKNSLDHQPVSLPEKMGKKQSKQDKNDDYKVIKSSEIRQWQDSQYLRSKQIGYNETIVHFLQKLHHQYYQNNKEWKTCFKSIFFDSGMEKVIIKTLTSKLQRLKLFQGGVSVFDLKKQNIEKLLDEDEDQENVQKQISFRIFHNLDANSIRDISKLLEKPSWKQDFKLFIFQQSPSIQKELSGFSLKVDSQFNQLHRLDSYYTVIDCIFFFSRRIDNFLFKEYLQRHLFQNKEEKDKLQKQKPWQLRQKIIKFFLKHLNQLKNK